MKTVEIYTDGACSGNPGPGGWGAILRYKETEKELSGGAADTTNNRMELTAVIEALALLKEPCVVELYSDSKYVIDGLSKGWAKGWQKRGWIKSDKKPALNPDLCPELDGQRRIFLCGFAHGFQQRPVDRQTVLIGFFCVLNHVFDKCPASVRVFALCDNSNLVG